MEKKTYRVCAKSISYVYVDIEAESEEKALEAATCLDGNEFNDDGYGDWEFGDVYEWDTDPDYTYDGIMNPV